MKQSNIIAFLMLFLATGVTPIIGMEAPNNILPVEILRDNVFSYLSFRQRCNAALVCKTWENIINNMLDTNSILPLEILRNQIFSKLCLDELFIATQVCQEWNKTISTMLDKKAQKIIKPLLRKGKEASMRNENSHARTLALQSGQQTLSPRSRQKLALQDHEITDLSPFTFVPVTLDTTDASCSNHNQLINHSNNRSLTPITETNDELATTPRSSNSTTAMDAPGSLSPRSPIPRSLSSRSLMRSPRPESPIPPYLLQGNHAAAGRTNPQPTRSQTAQRKLFEFASLSCDVAGPSSQVPSDSDFELASLSCDVAGPSSQIPSDSDNDSDGDEQAPEQPENRRALLLAAAIARMEENNKKN